MVQTPSGDAQTGTVVELAHVQHAELTRLLQRQLVNLEAALQGAIDPAGAASQDVPEHRLPAIFEVAGDGSTSSEPLDLHRPGPPRRRTWHDSSEPLHLHRPGPPRRHPVHPVCIPLGESPGQSLEVEQFSLLDPSVESLQFFSNQWASERTCDDCISPAPEESGFSRNSFKEQLVLPADASQKIVLELEQNKRKCMESDDRLAVLCFCDAQLRHAFERAARQVEDVMFAYSTVPEVASKYEATAPSLKMFFPHDEQSATFAGDLNNAEEIESFVKAYRHPMVTDFSGETAADLFSDGRAILFLFRDKDGKGEAAEQALRAAAKQMSRKVLVALAGSSEPMDQRLMDYVSVDVEELPTARLVTEPQGAMAKYRLESDVTEASLLTFVQDFEAGRLKKYLQSEPVPTSQPGPVHNLVGSTFDAIVKDPAKDVLVEFYAPWCGHCKKLEPVYASVAKKLESVPSIVIAKIDATANDVDGVDIEGFPTIKFWRADNKEEPLDYDGDRDVDSFLAWLDDKAARPFGHSEL